jgi:hypothetical protein
MSARFPGVNEIRAVTDRPYSFESTYMHIFVTGSLQSVNSVWIRART